MLRVNSRHKLVRIGFSLLIAVSVTVWAMRLMRSDQSEVVLSTGTALTPQWQDLRASQVMRTTGDRSELVLELPGMRFDDSKNLRVEGYLTSDTGEKISFDDVSRVGFGTVTCLELSSSTLEGKRHEYSFSRVSLRSDRSVTLGKVVWISYDPSATKDGVAFPRALRDLLSSH
jgi:hypothetical protein